MRRGVRIGVDVGSVRIGVARSDMDGILAVPVSTVPRGEGDLVAVLEIAREWEALEIIVGLPLGMDGREGPAAAICREFATDLSVLAAPIPVRLVDERLSTVSAHKSMASAGRNSRGRRNVVDQQAAVIIVQSALDSERSSGREPGVPA